MNKHTKGNWTWTANEHSVPSIFKADDLTFRIAELLGNTPEDKANANLIALAPDLLNAIKLMVDKHESIRNDEGEYIGLFKKPTINNDHVWHQRLKDLIAEAGGE